MKNCFRRKGDKIEFKRMSDTWSTFKNQCLLSLLLMGVMGRTMPPNDVQVLVVRLVAHVVLLAKGMRQM